MTREFEGKDLDEAVRGAAAATGADPRSLAYEIVEEGRRGVFGLGARSVRIRLVDDEPLPADEPSRAADEPAEIPPVGFETTLRRILGLMRLDLHAKASSSNAVCTVFLDGEDRKLLLQRDAELLSSLEVILNRMARRTWPDLRSIRLEIEGHRHRRDEELVELARETAEQVLRTGRPRTFPLLNPYERRLVHMTAQEFPGLSSRSDGEGFLKQITYEKTQGS